MSSHSAALRRAKVSDEKIEALKNSFFDKSLFDERELLVIELADRICESGYAVSDELYARLLGSFTEAEIVEIVCVCGMFNYFNRVNDALHMEVTK